MLGRFAALTLVICGSAAAQHQGSPRAEVWKRHLDSGMNLETRGQYSDAKAELQLALQAAGDSRNPGGVFLSKIELGSVAAALGQYTEAEQWDNDALRMGLELYGSQGSELAVPFTNLAALYRDQGDYARAEEFGRRALRLVSGPAPAPPAARADVLGAMGGILMQRGNLEEAEADLRESIQIAETLPAASGILAGARNNLAGLYARTGRYSEALELYRDAYALCSKINGHDPNLFFILAGMAAVQAQSGQYADAVSSIQSAIQRAEIGGPARTMQVRDALLAEAEWLHKLKRDGEARRVRAQAKEVAKAAAQNSYSQYTVDARQVAQGMVGKTE